MTATPSKRTTPLPPLVPEARRAAAEPGALALTDDTPIVLGPGTDTRDFATARALRDGILERTGVRLAIESHHRCQGLGQLVLLERGERGGLGGDAYEIEVDSQRATLRGAGPAGLRWAVSTALQLLPERAHGSRTRLPACRIDDAPDLELRGLMLDISRCKVPTRQTVEQVIELCASLKLNTLMLYTEHTFRFRRHPEIGAGASPLDAETLRSLDAYAAERFVELVPCLQSLGHMEHILKLERYAHLAETELGWTMSPQEPGTYELLRDLYDEYLPNFRSGLFNANCDEPWDLERGKSKARGAALGPGGVYLEHIARIRDLAKEHDKRLMIWGDVVHAHPERIPEIPSDLVLLDWWYEAAFDYDRVSAFARNQLDFVVCPGTSSWNCLFPRIENSCANTERWAQAARRHGARGLVTTDWGDHGHYNLQGNSWLGFAWAAQQGWSGACEVERFDRAFSRAVFGDASGELARIYRALGAVHDPGFTIFNGSAIQYLFFDELEEAFFIGASKRAALRRCEQRLAKLRPRIEAARPKLRRERLTADELAHAADASLHAVRKARAGLDYLDWRRAPKRWKAPKRRALARELRALADEGRACGRELKRLWLARAAISNFELTQRRLDRSLRSLRRAARRLEEDRPGPPPDPHPGFTPQTVLAAVLAGTR